MAASMIPSNVTIVGCEDCVECNDTLLLPCISIQTIEDMHKLKSLNHDKLSPLQAQTAGDL